MLDQLASAFRKISGCVAAAGVMLAFYMVLFAGVPVDKRGRPKPPLDEQLLFAGLVIAVSLPGVIWGVVRAANGKQKTPWE
jgi:hypothetical protein